MSDHSKKRSFAEITLQTPDSLPPRRLSSIPMSCLSLGHLAIFLVLLLWGTLGNAQNDSLQTSTIRPAGDTDSLDIRISPDALTSPVLYQARDTQWVDIQTKKIHLIGDAQVTYQDIQLNAGYIVFSFDSNIVSARGLADSTGQLSEFPRFQQGDQSFTSREMQYNFKTKKGLSIRNATEEGDLHVVTDRAKFVGAETDQQRDVIYGKSALITTCNAEEKHYGIRSTRQKIIPDRAVIVGPSNLEIAGIPTPIWLPFGFFPISSKRKAGLIFSLDYDYRQDLGYGLRGIGYFTPIGPYANLSVTGDIYTGGSYRVNARSNYSRKYHYSGNAELTWTDFARESPETGKTERERLFRVMITHNQDAKANPYHNLSGRIQFESSAFSRLNYYDANNVLANTVSSSMNYRRTWDDKPFQFTASVTQSQNLRSGRIDMSLPEASFVVQRIQPFKRKSGGSERWYERIGINYSANLISRLSAPDSVFFTRENIRNARPGLRQTAAVNSNFNLFRYLNFTPNLNYTEVWNYNTLRRENDGIPTVQSDTIFNSDGSVLRIESDTLSYGTVRDRLVDDMKTFRQLSFGMGMNTAIFGTVRFSKGWLRGLRHTVKPSISLNFNPANTRQPWFGTFNEGRLADGSDIRTYSYFEGGPFGAPALTEGAMSMNYTLNNIFEAKYFSKKDTISKKVNLFDNIILTGNHNFFADSLRWSQVRISGGTNLLKNIARFDVGITLDPYAEENGRRVARYYWATDGKPLRFVQANFRLTTNLTLGKLRELVTGEPAKSSDDVYGLFESFGIQHNITTELRPGFSGDTLLIGTHSINTAGSIKISPRWQIQVGNIGYDFRSERITYPSFNFVRDLHCWEMVFGWFPQIGAYTFMIKVKPSSLDFIKIPYRRNTAGNFVGFGF